jgi:hypothetical protein
LTIAKGFGTEGGRGKRKKEQKEKKNTERGARTLDHQVKSLTLYRLS